jgi:hypothetical protein
MESMENTTPAVVTEDTASETPEISADELFENLTSEEEPEQEEPAQEEQAEQEEQTEEEELSPEEAQKQAITIGLQALFEDGWTNEELLAFSKDKTVRADIAAGKDVIRAAMAYERRQRTAAPAKSAKKSVPTLKSAATSGARNSNRIDEMTDAEFDAFSRKAQAAMREGKLVRFQ